MDMPDYSWFLSEPLPPRDHMALCRAREAGPDALREYLGLTAAPSLEGLARFVDDCEPPEHVLERYQRDRAALERGASECEAAALAAWAEAQRADYSEWVALAHLDLQTHAAEMSRCRAALAAL